MRSVKDAAHGRGAHIQVGRGHVDFCSQDTCPVGKLALPHADKEVEISFYPVAIEAVFAGG